jgi:hypothetical protein
MLPRFLGSRFNASLRTRYSARRNRAQTDEEPIYEAAAPASDRLFIREGVRAAAHRPLTETFIGAVPLPPEPRPSEPIE